MSSNSAALVVSARSVAARHAFKVALETKSWGGLTFKIDRPKGFKKEWPRDDGTVKKFTYPVDYGFFIDHTGEDDEGLDAFVGDNSEGKIESFLKMKPGDDGSPVPDETKFLIGLTEDEREKVLALYEPESIVGLREYADVYELVAALNAFRDKKASALAPGARVLDLNLRALLPLRQKGNPIEADKSGMIDGKMVRGDDFEYYEALMNSMRRHGMEEPIAIAAWGKRPHVVEGHHRLSAAWELGWKTIKTLVDSSITDEMLQKMGALPNKSAASSVAFKFGGREASTVEKYEPDPGAPQNGEWVRDEDGDAIRWRQNHQKLVAQALNTWKGSPTEMILNIRDEMVGHQHPGSGNGKKDRAAAGALLWEMQHNSKASPVPLYRGSHEAPTELQAWTTSRKYAEFWAGRNGGRVLTLPKGTRGIRTEDYIPAFGFEKEWIVSHF